MAAERAAQRADMHELLAFLKSNPDAIRQATAPRGCGGMRLEARSAIRRIYDATLAEELREHRGEACVALALDRILAGNEGTQQPAMTLETACELRRGAHRLARLDKQVSDLLAEIDELAASLSLVPGGTADPPSLEAERMDANRAAAELERQGEAMEFPDRIGRGVDDER